MLYSVEIAFTNSEHEADWNAWYETFLVKLVSVPGFKTAQRFQGQSPYSSPYLALYSVTSRAVFDSQPYRDIGGGGAAVGRFAQYRQRKRNLFSGIDFFPSVSGGSCVVIVDCDPEQLDLPNLLFTPLAIADFDRTVERRFITVTSEELARRLRLAEMEGVGLYRPANERRTALPLQK